MRATDVPHRRADSHSLLSLTRNGSRACPGRFVTPGPNGHRTMDNERTTALCSSCGRVRAAAQSGGHPGLPASYRISACH
jgi:hypothetical protein